MPQIFIFTAGQPEAQHHLMDSIVKPIDEEMVLGSLHGFSERGGR